MKKRIKIEAANIEEAYSIGKKKLTELMGRKIDRDNLTIIEITGKRGFPGFRKKKEFEVIYEDSLTRQDEEFLETVIVDIDINGSFKIKVADDGIFLKVSAPKGRGKFVSIVDVNSVIEEIEFVEVDWQMVRQTINNA